MSCVIGVPDPYKMQKVKAFVMLKPRRARQRGHQAGAAGLLPPSTSPSTPCPTTSSSGRSMPKTLVGKVAYRVLEDEEKARIAAQAAQPEA